MIKKVIIDCDPGIDDALALMLALSMKDKLDVIGITVTAGNCPVETGYKNALKILDFMGRRDIPVYMGASKPIKRAYIDALDTHGSDGLGESFLAENMPYEIEKETALEFMTRSLLSDKISVIALGPLTNLAELSKASYEAFSNIDELVSMGGCFKAHGNCSPVAEYNYFCDPDAAKIVFDLMYTLNKKIHMAGLDVTRKIVLTPNLLSCMKRFDRRIGEFIEKITGFYFDFHWEWEHIIGCVINDPLAVAYFVFRDLCSGFEAFVDIETDGICIGQSVVDSMKFYQKRPNAVVLVETDSLKFFELFFSYIFGKSVEELEILKELV